MRISIFLVLFLALATFTLGCYNLYLAFTHPMKFKDEIIFHANKNDLSPNLVASVINVESSFNDKAKSNKSAIGLMQIKLTTANYVAEINNEKSLTEDELFIPDINIKYGCSYLKYLIKKFQHLDTALAAYNAGETRVRSWLNSGIYSTDKTTLGYIPYEETRNYIEKIHKNLNFYYKIFK